MAASAWLITSASFHPPLSTLAVGITLVRAAGLFRAVFRYLDRYLTHNAIFEQLTQIRLKLYEFALLKFPLKSGATGEAEMLHDLTVSADIVKDFFPRVIQPIFSTIIILLFVTAYLFKIIGMVSLTLPLSIILTLSINYFFANFQDVDDTNYREKLLDFHDGREEIINAGSSDIVIAKLNAEAENLRRIEQFNRNKIANIDSICAAINAAVFVWIFSELAKQVDLIDLAVWVFILILTLELLSTLPNTVRHLIKINRINFYTPEKC